MLVGCWIPFYPGFCWSVTIGHWDGCAAAFYGLIIGFDDPVEPHLFFLRLLLIIKLNFWNFLFEGWHDSITNTIERISTFGLQTGDSVNYSCGLSYTERYELNWMVYKESLVAFSWLSCFCFYLTNTFIQSYIQNYYKFLTIYNFNNGW